ncbi:MAG: hypothetical protein R3F30_06790 [Planctomycetota bacterium]
MSRSRSLAVARALLRRRSLFTLTALFLAAALPAQTAVMVKDINAAADVNGEGSDPDPAQAARTNDLQLFAQIGPITYFSARTQASGTELWATLGTKASTQMVADLWPGKGNSDPAEMTVVGSLLFFVASDPTNGRELRVFNGTSVALVADIVPGIDGSDPSGLAALGSKLVFAADDGKNGTELWITDGTKAGTSLLKDCWPGTTSQYGVTLINSSTPNGMTTETGGKRVWFAADMGQGNELWVTDGTTAGTFQVKDINTTSATASGNPISFRFVNGKTLFQANDGLTGNELWVSDGTSAGTKLVLDIRPGTGAGALLTNSIVNNGLLFFRGNDTTAGAEAWVSDGTTAGTKLLADAYAGTTAGQIFYPVIWKGKVAYGARSSAGYGIWTSDGTTSGTSQLVVAGNASLQWLAATTKGLFFGVNGGQGVEPWVSDGTAAGTKQIADLNSTAATASSTPQYFVEAIPGNIVFTATDGKTGKELWFTDGTAANTINADLNQPTVAPTLGSTPRSMAALGNLLLFAAQDVPAGRELWVSDGTAAGTKLLVDIRAGTTGSSPNYLCRLGGVVLFNANDGTNGAELWVTDGTAAGTKLLKDIRSGSASSSPNNLCRIRDKVYFAANDGSGNELWVSDGTAAGTVLLKDINTSSATASSTPASLCQLGSTGSFLFRATDGSSGIELWISDGTAAGTQLVKDINSGSASSSPNNLASIGGMVWFSANDGAAGNELWVSDGTAAGTKMLVDIWQGSTAGVPNYFAEIAGKVLFQARDPLAGTELYESDGTAAGTKLFRDFIPGYGKSGGGRTSFESKAQLNDGAPSYLTPVGSRRLLFTVNTTSYGNDLFQTDGTQAGTKLAYDIAPANNSSDPLGQNDGFRSEYTVVQGKVFFSADDGVHGTELWMFDNGATANPVLFGCGASVMTGTDPVMGATFSLAGKAAGSPIVNVTLLGDLLPSAPAFGVGCPILVDIGKPFFVLPPTVGASWQLTGIPVPNNASLLGVNVRAQTWHLTASFPANTDLTNAVDLTIGK